VKNWSGAAHAAPLRLKLYIFLPGVFFVLSAQSGAVLLGGGADFQFGVVLQSKVQPLSYCVLSSPRNIQLASFLNGFFQFLFDLRLCFAKDVLADGLTCRWVISCGISALSAAILSLTDAALAVRSLFCHFSALPHSLAGLPLIFVLEVIGRQVCQQFLLDTLGQTVAGHKAVQAGLVS
jgi:hypothetical protein